LRTKKSSAYDPAFKQHLIDHGVYPHEYNYNNDDGSVYPDNWEKINGRLAQPRPSLSPSRFPREEFRKFEKTNMQALTENKVMSKVFPIIAGTADILSQENLQFENLKDLTDGSITKAQPDFYNGVCSEELNKQVREELGPYIVPLTNKSAPCLANFFMEAKGPKGFTDVGKLQALYDGTIGARGTLKTQLYIDSETAYDNKAYTITSTYHPNGLLTMYTTHPTRSRDHRLSTEYHMTQLKAFAMTSDPETFRQGATFLRNGRGLAEEERKKLITAVNAKALNEGKSEFGSSTQSFLSQSTTEAAHLESETLADELALDNGTYIRPTHRTPVGARMNPSPKISSNRRLKKKPVRVDRGSGTGYGGLQKI